MFNHDAASIIESNSSYIQSAVWNSDDSNYFNKWKSQRKSETNSKITMAFWGKVGKAMVYNWEVFPCSNPILLVEDLKVCNNILDFR